MLQLRTDLPLAVHAFTTFDVDGVDALVTVAKATIGWDGGRSQLAATQAPIALADRHHGDQLTTSIDLPGDLSLPEPGTDILVHGHARSPEGRPTTAVEGA